MITDDEPSMDDCIRVPGEEQPQGEPIQWSRQAAVELSLHLMAWPELDVPHWPGGQAWHKLKFTPGCHGC
jgi:hypothetical protein